MAWNTNYPAWNGGYAPQQTYIPQMSTQSPSGVFNSGQGLSPASRMVSNRDEANATPADFSGSLMVFPDIHNNRVYVKRWNNQTGAADFFEFVPYVPAEAATVPQYATVEQLEAVLAEIESLKKPKKAVKKDESDE